MIKPFWKQPFFVLIFTTMVVLITYGSRQSFGMFMHPITEDMGWGRETLSFAIAIQNLIYGLAAPCVGFIADRWGPIKVLVVASSIYAVGLFLMSQSSTPAGMLINIGFLTGLGASGCALPLALSLVGRVAPEEKQSMWFGIVVSGGTAGQLLIVPSVQGLITGWGWVVAAMVLAAMVSLVIPLAGAISKASSGAFDRDRGGNLADVIKAARGHGGFWLLVTGFYVCGFQVQFINSHLPAYLAESPVGAIMGAVAIALIGFFNMIGTWASGWLGGHFRKKYLLSGLYFSRSLVIFGFISLPLTETSVIVFASLVGLLWLATVPLTSGIVVQIFGPRYLATLYGMVFMSHQLGSFTSVWMGGRIFDQTGSYNAVWWAVIVAGLVASLMHFPIDDKRIKGLVVEDG